MPKKAKKNSGQCLEKLTEVVESIFGDKFKQDWSLIASVSGNIYEAVTTGPKNKILQITYILPPPTSKDWINWTWFGHISEFKLILHKSFDPIVKG